MLDLGGARGRDADGHGDAAGRLRARDARRRHPRARRAGPAVAHVRDGRPARAAERGRAQLGPAQRVARDRPGDRRRPDRHRRRRRLLPRQHAQLPRRPRGAARDARGRALPGGARSHGHARSRERARGCAFALARPAGARRARRRHVRRARRLQLQHARAAARLGHAARRRAGVRAPLGGVRPRRVRRRDRHGVVQAGDVPGVHGSARSGSASSCSRSPRCTRHALAGVLLVGVGASFTLFAANANALVQLAAPDHLRGRLVALYLFAFVGLAPLGSLLSGALVELGGTRLAFVVAGTVGLAATAFAAPTAARARPRAAPRTRERRLTASPPISRVPACHEEELDDDLREPRFRLREQPDGRRRRPALESRRPARRLRRAASARRTPAA